MNLLFALLSMITVMCWLWLWFMVKRPERWEALVDRENAFWVRKGIASAEFAEKIKRFEKGRVQKAFVGGTAVLGTVILVMIAMLILRGR